MIHVVLADNNPILATGGQIAAIIIGLFALIFIVIALAFNFAMAAGLSWVREKANLVKMLRPTVDSVNKTTEALEQGTPPPANENKIVRTVAEGPVRVRELDKQADRLADRVANATIEFRARTIQIETVFKAFFTPKRLQRDLEAHDRELEGRSDMEITSPGYRILMDKVPDIPDAPVVPTPEPTSNDGQTVTASQLRDAPSR